MTIFVTFIMGNIIYLTGTIRMNPPSFYQSIEFYATKLLHFILLLFIPMMIMPLTLLVSSCVHHVMWLSCDYHVIASLVGISRHI